MIQRQGERMIVSGPVTLANVAHVLEEGYAQIRAGADDEAEMGAFHDLYQPQRAANLRDFQRVRQAGAVMIAGRREKDLRLVLQTPEGLAVNDAVAIALKGRTDGTFRLRSRSSARLSTLHRLRRKFTRFFLFHQLSNGLGHRDGGLQIKQGEK